uniref:Uncharacterized protein n=1 Tax=Oryza rufipogon TaxID=4529 RepID=A0A0E0N8N4_ORYRU
MLISPKEQLMFTGRGSVFAQSFLEEIYVMLLQGKCLHKPLSMDDMVVSALGRVHLRDGILMRPIAESRRAAIINSTWFEAMKLLKQMLAYANPHNFDLPPDFLHLCNTMENRHEPKSINIPYHASLLPLHSRQQALLDAYNLLARRMNFRYASWISCELPHRTEWPQVLHGNNFLQQWFRDKQWLNDDGTFKVPTGIEFLRAHRVLCCHSDDFARKGVCMYTWEQLHLLIHGKNPLVLPDLHLKLMRADRSPSMAAAEEGQWVLMATGRSPTNIAVIKYWGKRDEALILPVNDSISVTLDPDHLSATTTTVAVSPSFPSDRMWLNGKVLLHLSALLLPTFFRLLRIDAYAFMSPDCFLQGSGSACRSIYGGFVKWCMGKNNDGSDSIAVQLADEAHWNDLVIIIAVVSSKQKETSSTSGMRDSVETSPLLQYRAQTIVPERVLKMEEAIKSRNFESFARIISLVEKWNQSEGTPQVAYTFDAVPNAVLIAPNRKNSTLLLQKLLLGAGPKVVTDESLALIDSVTGLPKGV